MTEATHFCYESVNASCPKTIYPTLVRVLLHISFAVIIFITLCGNLLIIISIAHFKQLHTPTNYLILSLAVTDFLLGGFVLPPYMMQIIETCWYFGDVFCRIHMSTDLMLYMVSLLNLSFISIDRYFAVCQPLHYQTRITPYATRIVILVSWSVATLVCFGIIILHLSGHEDENIACVGGCVQSQNEAAGLIYNILCFYIPAFIMLVMYQKIFNVARKQVRSIHNITCNNVKSENSTSSSKKEQKATKTLAIVVGAFWSCCSPLFVCTTINPFINYYIPPVIIEAFFCISYLNSACNPIIYAFYYSWFRKAFKMIIFGEIFQANSSRIKLSTD